jgi:hypothetical protein
MLPNNRLRPFRMDKLKIFPEADHPFGMLPLVPYQPPARKLALPGLGWPLPDGLQPMNPEKYGFRARATPWLRQGVSGGGSGSGGGQAAAGGLVAGHNVKPAGTGRWRGSDGEVLAGQKRATPLQVVQGLRDLDKLLTPEELRVLHTSPSSAQRR